MATIEDDEDEAISAHASVPDPDDEDEDEAEVPPEEDEEETSGRLSESSFDAFEGKTRRTAADRLKTYRAKLMASVEERVTKRRADLDDWVQNRIDEWNMKHVGTGAVANPEAVATSLARQAIQAENRLKGIRDQLSQLEAAGVDVAALREQLENPAESAA